MASLRGSGTSTLSAMFKVGKANARLSAGGQKARSAIVKGAVKSAISANKPTKFSKVTGVKPLKVPTNIVDPQYKSSMGSFLTGEMRKAKKTFMGPTP